MFKRIVEFHSPVTLSVLLPIRAAFADQEKNRKSLVSGGGSGDGGGSSARAKVAAVVVATVAVVLFRPLTLYRPSATVLFHFVLKLIFSENIKL